MRILEKSHFGIITTHSWNIIIEYSNYTLHTSSNSDGTEWNASRNHISELNALQLQNQQNILGLLEKFSASVWIPAGLLVNAKKQSTCAVQNDLTYEHKSPKSLNAYLREILYIELR